GRLEGDATEARASDALLEARKEGGRGRRSREAQVAGNAAVNALRPAYHECAVASGNLAAEAPFLPSCMKLATRERQVDYANVLAGKLPDSLTRSVQC